MFTSERQKKIEDYVLERGSATVQELVDRADIGRATFYTHYFIYTISMKKSTLR